MAARNSSRASSYQNECIANMPRKKWRRDSSEPVTGNSIRPSEASGFGADFAMAVSGKTARAKAPSVLRRMTAIISRQSAESDCRRLAISYRGRGARVATDDWWGLSLDSIA